MEKKPHFHYLTETQYKTLESYQHYAPKTSYELFMLNSVTTHVEKRLPANWTANTVTIIGNLAMPIAGFVAISYGGL
jgi:hypothetical protein